MSEEPTYTINEVTLPNGVRVHYRKYKWGGIEATHYQPVGEDCIEIDDIDMRRRYSVWAERMELGGLEP